MAYVVEYTLDYVVGDPDWVGYCLAYELGVELEDITPAFMFPSECTWLVPEYQLPSWLIEPLSALGTVYNYQAGNRVTANDVSAAIVLDHFWGLSYYGGEL